MARHKLTVSDSVARELRKIAEKMSGTVSVGFLEGAVYSDGTPVASVAFWDEYGHGGPFPSPPRPFFRNMIAAKSPQWPTQMAAIAKATDNDGAKVLQLMGEGIQGQLIESILNFDSVPLSPTTLVLRKRFGNNPQNITATDVVAAQEAVRKDPNAGDGASTKQLVWTGWMSNHTGYEVKK